MDTPDCKACFLTHCIDCFGWPAHITPSQGLGDQSCSPPSPAEKVAWLLVLGATFRWGDPVVVGNSRSAWQQSRGAPVGHPLSLQLGELVSELPLQFQGKGGGGEELGSVTTKVAVSLESFPHPVPTGQVWIWSVSRPTWTT